ncbi:MAG: hypothetical protein IJ242_02125 [Clostridia bacterium]|nr:hypothetical protein [Clostridia bacterium]
MSSVSRRISFLLALVVFLLCFGLTIGTFAIYGQYNLDSDMSSDFVLAQLLNEEGSILTTHYYYSGDLNILSPILVYQAALKIFSSWHVARTVSIAVLLLIMTASLFFLGRSVGISGTTTLLCAAALVLPISKYHAFTLIYGSFYTVWVALTFFELGLIFRMRKKRPLEPILLIVFGVLGGLSGVRMLMVCGAPLLLACVICFFSEVRTAKNLREITALPAFPVFAGSLLCVASNLIGYVINDKILSNIFHFMEFDDMVLRPLAANRLPDQIIAVMRFLGYREESILVSTEGIFSLFTVALPVLGVTCLILLLKMDLTSEQRLLASFVLTGVTTGMVINFSVILDAQDIFSISYFMPALLLLIYAVFWFLERFQDRYVILRMLPMLLGVGLFLLGFSIYKDQEVNTYDDEMTIIADTILAEDCNEGYATYWLANVLTEISDGKIDVYTVDDWETGQLDTWLQREDHFTSEPKGRVFAIFSQEDYDNGIPGCDTDHLIYSSEKAYVCLYENVQEFHELRGDTY